MSDVVASVLEREEGENEGGGGQREGGREGEHRQEGGGEQTGEWQRRRGRAITRHTCLAHITHSEATERRVLGEGLHTHGLGGLPGVWIRDKAASNGRKQRREGGGDRGKAGREKEKGATGAIKSTSAI